MELTKIYLRQKTEKTNISEYFPLQDTHKCHSHFKQCVLLKHINIKSTHEMVEN